MYKSSTVLGSTVKFLLHFSYKHPLRLDMVNVLDIDLV